MCIKMPYFCAFLPRPGKHIQELRQYERRYVHLCENVTRIDRQLHRCNIRITNFTSKVGSVTVMGVVRGLVKGETTPEELIRHIHGRITNKHKEKNSSLVKRSCFWFGPVYLSSIGQKNRHMRVKGFFACCPIV
jgi:hypothetical protein